MITDIPTPDEFQASASELLNSAWNQVAELLIEFDSISSFLEGDKIAPEITPDGDTMIRVPQSDEVIERNTEQYWKASKQTMSVALTLIQQAVEFYIKGRIVHISPHLLLTAPVSSWPKKCNSENVSFSSFKTIDAQDLIKVHDTVCEKRFDDNFKRWYEEMRGLRNKVMHSVPKELNLTPEKLLESILYVHDYFGPNDWVLDRQIFLSHTPSFSTELVREVENVYAHILLNVYKELEVVINKLSPSVVSKHFNYDKKARALICPRCHNELIKLDSYDIDNAEHYFKAFQDHQCVICEYIDVVTFKEKKCEVCEKSLIDNKTDFCLYCGNDDRGTYAPRVIEIDNEENL